MAKPRKVQEAAAPYLKEPAKPTAALNTASLDEVRASNAKLVKIHRKVLQRLAQ